MRGDDWTSGTIRKTGTVFRRRTLFHVDRTLAGMLAFLAETDATLLVFDDQGTLFIEQA